MSSVVLFGRRNIQIDFPNGERESINDIPLSTLTKSFSFSKSLEDKHSDGDYDYYLTPAQYATWRKLIDTYQ